MGARHGGDFKGVKQSLSYIKSLGFDAIWISPVFQTGRPYYGYAQRDFTLLTIASGRCKTFARWSDEPRLGMTIVDIVVNHMANLFYFEGIKQGAPFHMHTGEYEVTASRQEPGL